MNEEEKVGRPAKFKTVKDLEEMIDSYFKGDCNCHQISIGGTIKVVPVPTVTGLATYLGFCSRQSFYDYEKREEFSYTIKMARAFIETHYEEMLQIGNTTGAIFALKNMGWRDKIENTNTNINYNTGEMTKEEVKDISDKLEDDY